MCVCERERDTLGGNSHPDVSTPAPFSLLHAWDMLAFFYAVIIFFNFLTFIFERETDCKWGRGRERGRHRI